MNDNQEVPNKALRTAATSVAFNLTLTRNQVGVLDAVARGSRQVTQGTERSDALWVPTAWGLKRRGLMLHVDDCKTYDEVKDEVVKAWGRPAKDLSPDINDYYRLTRAGWLMHDLLSEAGVVEAVTSRKLRRKVA